MRVTSSCETPASASEVSDAASHASPGLQRAVVQHLLHVQGAHEEEGKEAADQQHRCYVRAGKRAQPEDRERQNRPVGPFLDREEGDEQHNGCRQDRDRPRGAPAVLGGLGDRVNEQHQSARASDRTGQRQSAGAR